MNQLPKDDEAEDRRDVQRTKVLRNAKIIAPRRLVRHSLHRAEHHLERRLPETRQYLGRAGDISN